MKRHLLPLLIAASVILLFVYACYTRFFPNHLTPSASGTQGVNPAQSSKHALSGIGETIASREYHITHDHTRRMLQSPNRKHNLRAYYQPGNLTIQNRVDSSGHNFSFTLKNQGIWADGDLIGQPDPAAKPEIRENRLQIHYAKFVEEFINNEDGVRQNFIVREAPAGTKELKVKLAARGLRIQHGGKNELLLFAQNDATHPRLIYRDLQCWDAHNQPLTAHLTGQDQQILITVDVRNATYPVTIDPIVTNGNPANANALLESDQADAWLGFSVASAGDVNGDGYSDVLAGAPHYDNGEDSEGAAFLYYGSANGLGPAPTLLESNQAHAQMGYSVASAGDINSDGFSDIAIGAPFYDNGQVNEGAIFVHLGSPKGIKPNPAAILEGNQSGAQFGIAIALAGDINGDHYSDLIAGANKFSQGQLNEGAAFIYYGSKAGVDPNLATTLEMNQPVSGMGTSVAGAGDVNADGFGDVLVGAPFYDQGETDEGAAFVYLGSVKGISQSPTIMQSNQADAHLGTALASAGDLNGDNFSDIIVGIPHYDKAYADQGLVKIHLGSANGINPNTAIALVGQQMTEEFGRAVACAGDIEGDGHADILISSRTKGKNLPNEGVVMLFPGIQTGIDKTPASVFKSGQANAYFGQSLASAGDIDGDGYSDIIMGAHLYDHGESDEGAIMVWHGGASHPDTASATALHSIQPESQFGYAVSGAGDVDGDGYGDMIVGAPRYDNGQSEEGAAFLFKGTPNGISKTATNMLEADQADAGFGTSVSAAGDVNGDGFDDVLVGAPLFDNGLYENGAVFVYHGSKDGLNPIPAIKLEIKYPEQSLMNSKFGFSTSGGGDINGDGYADIVIGAYNYSHDQESEGAVFIFYGSSSGITETGKVVIESNQPNISFGYSVWNNCDTNGDGYSDVLIGTLCSANYGAPEGEAHVYFGSQNGVNLASLLVIKGDKPGALIGNAVAGAGDLNDDGFDEIIIGAKNYEGKGAAFIFSGSQAGPITISPQILKGDQDNAEMGYAVSSAGDVNGDGYDDIIIGSRLYDTDSPSPKNGIAQIFLGSLVGVTNQPSFILKDNLPRISSAAERFGCSVACAGDVNGDGYSDVIVGADFRDFSFSFEGGAFIFNGSSSGVSLNHSFYLTGGQHYVHMGQSVSGAGDVNGDGVSDVIIGVPNSDYNQNIKESGKALVLYGNASKTTILNNLRLYNTDLTTPINHTQFPQANFGAGLFAKSFTGRNKGKLVWEAKPTGQGFSKGSNNRITNSTQSTNSQNTYSNLGTTGLELKNVIDKQGPGTKVRVRVKYDPILALTGQSYGPWRYLPAYLMGNSTAPVPEEGGNDLSETIEKKIIHLDEGKALESATIYPNPVSNRLNIDFKDQGQVQNLRIFTAAGSQVYQSNGFQPFVDVSKLPEGTYFLIVTKTDGSQTTRQILIRR